MKLSAIPFLIAMTVPMTATAETIDVWLGTGGGPSRGIYHCTLDLETGRLSESELAAEVQRPGFLAMHPDGHHLYAVGTLDGVASVIAYKIVQEGKQSKLTFHNSLPIGDGGAAHVAVDPTGHTLLTAQYGGGSVAAYQLNQDGSLKKQTALIKHAGGSRVVDRRQDSPHAHWVGFSPDNHFAFVPDLGLDQVVIYKVDTDSATLTRSGAADVPPGGGPRHLKFHPTEDIVYVLNELALSVTVFDYDPASGEMTAKQTIPAVPQAELDKELFKSSSEIRVHPNGRFVYSANRGHDTITVYSVDAKTGELAVVEREHVRGATPRNFNLDPSGRWLLAGGQDSHTLSVFGINEETGELTYNRKVINTPSPICVLFEHEGSARD